VKPEGGFAPRSRCSLPSMTRRMLSQIGRVLGSRERR
jgi:hypothetical protein